MRLARPLFLALPAIACAGLLNGFASATPFDVHYDGYPCTDPVTLSKPPAGPWVQSVQVCGPAPHVHVIGEYRGTSPCCVTIVTPWGWVDSAPLVVRVVIDGTPSVVPVPLPTGTVGTGGPICVYSNDPFNTYHCLL